MPAEKIGRPMKATFLALLALALVAAPRLAEETILHTGVVSSGGSSWAESETCAIQFSVGQPCVGVASTADNEGDVGFWYVVWTGYAPETYLGIRWAWIGFPFYPMFPDPRNALGYDCTGTLWKWDKYGKTVKLFRPPFLVWNVDVAESYLAYNESLPDPVCYSGFIPFRPFEFKLGKNGWTWLSIPGVHELGYPSFMDVVQVEYPTGSGNYRTAAADKASAQPWASWGWAFWDTQLQCAKTFAPYLPFGNNVCYPWLGYRVYINVGAATNENDPDQVTLIWP